MQVELNSDEALKDIMDEIKRIQELTEKQEKKVMEQIRDVLVKKVRENLPKSAGKGTNYDGSRPYIHMRDDVKASIKSKGGLSSITVCGGKLTAFKWHLVNDGVRDSKGRVRINPTHFVDKAVIQAEPEIEKLIDDLVAEVANGGGA